MSSRTRPLTLEDAPQLADLVRTWREFLAPWEPDRDESWFTVDGQRTMIERGLEDQQRGAACLHVILDDDGCVVGRVSLNNVVRGPFLSCHLGYWLAEPATGRGLATAAVQELVALGFTELGLHRVQAGTLLHNVPSQKVLHRNGFARFGLAPAYLKIAGRWQDHYLYQLLNPAIR